jgi:hypothetical protein
MDVGAQGALGAIPLPGSEGTCLSWATLFWKTLQTPRGCSILGQVTCTIERVTEPGCAPIKGTEDPFTTLVWETGNKEW